MKIFQTEGQMYFGLFNNHRQRWERFASHYVKLDDEYYLLDGFIDAGRKDPLLLQFWRLDKSRIVPFDNFPDWASGPRDDFHELVNAFYKGDVTKLSRITMRCDIELAPGCGIVAG